MIASIKKILHLPVYTESGEKLGEVFDVEMDVDTHMVLRYFVRPNFFSLKSFLISTSQIKCIKDDRVVVYDSDGKDILTKATSAPLLEE